MSVREITSIALIAAIRIALTAIAITSVLAIVIALVWLAVLGEWGVILWGLVLLAATGLCFGVIGFLLLPTMFVLWVLMVIDKRWRIPLALQTIIGFFAGVLSALLMSAAFSAWGIGILYFFITKASPDALLPVLIYSHVVATSAISYMADRGARSANPSDKTADISENKIAVAFWISYIVCAAIIWHERAEFHPLTFNWFKLSLTMGGIVFVAGMLFNMFTGSAARRRHLS